MKDGKTFKVTPNATVETRRDWFKKGKSLIGRKLTVEFFELTNKGIPRFPKGIAIRDYE